MVKRQLGGLLGDYITYAATGVVEDSDHKKNKQNHNMVETLKEFRNKFETQQNYF
jgi:phosphodiesterase/alkaline phosphatase D-like protein